MVYLQYMNKNLFNWYKWKNIKKQTEKSNSYAWKTLYAKLFWLQWTYLIYNIKSTLI